jgi:hypothetical protein
MKCCIEAYDPCNVPCRSAEQVHSGTTIARDAEAHSTVQKLYVFRIVKSRLTHPEI